MLIDKGNKGFRVVRILFRVFFIIIALLLAFVVVLNIPSVQTFIAQKFINSIREKTGTELSIGSVKIAFPKTIVLTDIYITDQHADTLFFLNSLKADVNLLDLFKNKVDAQNLNLENLVAHLHRKNAEDKFNFQFILDALSSSKTDTTAKSSTPWSIRVTDLSLKNIRFSFMDEHANTEVQVNLIDFEGAVKDLDFDKKFLDLDKFILKNTSVKVVSTQSDDTAQFALTNADSNTIATNEKKKIPSLFPGWNISINHFALENTNFRYDDEAFQKLPDGFDSRHVKASNINSGIHNINISDEVLKGDINTLSFSEGCGFDLKKLACNVRLTEQVSELNNLIIETSRSKLSGDAKLSFSSFNDLIVNTGSSEGALDLKYADINMEDVFLLEQTLSTDSFFGKFRNSKASIFAKANGKINDLNVEHLEVSALQKTILKSHGKLTDMTDVKKLRFNAKVDLFSTVLPDVYQFIDSRSLAGMDLPKSMELKGTASGRLDSLLAELYLTTGYGNIDANTFYQTKKDGSDTFSLVFNAKNIFAGQILHDTLLGKVSISGKAGIARKRDSLLYGSADVMIDEAQYNSYVYKDIQISARKEGDIFSSTVTCSDANVNFELFADADLHEVKKRYTATLNLSKLNLQSLNFTKKDLSLRTNLKAELNYAGSNNSDGNLSLTNTNLISDNKIIPVKVFVLKAKSSTEGIDVQLNSDLADGFVNGNIKMDSLKSVLQTAFRKYYGQATSNDLEAGKHLSFQMNVHLPKEVISLINPKLAALEINKLEGNYTSDNNVLSLELQMPRVNYSGVLLDTVTMVANGKNENLSVDLYFSKASYSNLRIEKIRIKEKTDQGKILSEISIRDSSESLRYLFANELELKKEFTKIKFLPEGLILDGKAWSIDPENLFVRQKNPTDSAETFSIRQFVFKNEEQSFGVITEGRNQKIEFENFALENLVNTAEFQSKDSSGQRAKIISGKLNGEIVFPSFKSMNGLNANLAINNLYVMDTLVGNLALNIKAGNNKMDVDVRLESDENKILLSGIVDHLSQSPELNLTALLDINNLHRLERFSFGAVSNMDGKIDGKISVNGSMQKPEIGGYVGFDETAFKINSLNFSAKIKKEKVTLNNKSIHFDDFEIEDASAKILTINGDLLTNNFSNIGFDLNLVTKNFQPVNSTVADNKIFYGKLSMGADIKLRGNIKKPKIEADIKIDSATNLTYVLPGSELKLVSSEGIVQFMDSLHAFDTSATALLGDYMTDSILSRFKGINMKAHVEIDRGAKFTIDIDPKSGDYLTLTGKAKLDISSDETGKQSINGIYEVSSGFYELSFYDLVKKKFVIKPGSTIAWSGKPMDAELDITAEYVVRASSVGLVANETASMSEEEKKIFNRRLPYEVRLNIKGIISKPEISFNIFLPKQYMSDNQMVAAKLTQLNTEEMTPQLNKQVFALLVTGGFMPESPMTGTGSSNIASTAARNSVNGILSNQLNNVSSKYISGVDVNFGLTSYEDYASSSGDLRTEMDIQVSKKLFNDRLTVEAENSFGLKKSEKTSTTQQGYGQFAVIYSLTESGVYRLRAYYQNAYDPFDGDFSYSGIALIFEKEFDSLKRNRPAVTTQPPKNNK